MQFTVERQPMVNAMAAVIGAVDKRITIPVLSGMRLETCNGGVEITGTDLELSMRAFVPADVGRQGARVMPAHRLYSYIRLLPEGVIGLEGKDSGHLRVDAPQCGARLYGISADYPQIPEAPEHKPVRIDAEALLTMAARVKYAIASDNARIPAAVLLERKDGTLRMAATDGHRLTIASLESDGMDFRAVMPEKALQLLRSFTGEVSISKQDGTVFIETADMKMSCREVAGTFPDFSRVLAQVAPHELRVDARELLGAIKRCSVNAEVEIATIPKIALELAPESITVKLVGNEVEATETVEAKSDGTIPTVTLSFHAKYPSQFLEQHEGTITIRHAGPNSAMRMEADGNLCLIMPVRG